MNLLELITSRESVRNYDPAKLVSEQDLKTILEAGRMAPSACNRQPWKFLLISSQPMLKEISECYPRPWFAEAPHILVVQGNKKEAWVRGDGYNSIETDLAIAMNHMILAAESLGVSTCWIEAFNYELLRQKLNLTEDELVFALTPLGYPKKGFEKSGQKNRKKFSEVVKFL